MATMRKKSGASKGKGKGKSGTVLKDLAAKRVAGGVKGGVPVKYLDVKLKEVFITNV